jgi:hypothetical protein|tara:strand:- start:280 stop:459 length:180 start_codon:yes stop_codon:yes gene_type:complete
VLFLQHRQIIAALDSTSVGQLHITATIAQALDSGQLNAWPSGIAFFRGFEGHRFFDATL